MVISVSLVLEKYINYSVVQIVHGFSTNFKGGARMTSVWETLNSPNTNPKDTTGRRKCNYTTHYPVRG